MLLRAALLLLPLALCLPGVGARRLPAEEPDAGSTQAQTLRVLFIGNSYTARHNLPLVVKSMAEAGNRGLILEPTAIIYGGRTLADHWKLGTQNFVKLHSLTEDDVVSTIASLEQLAADPDERYAPAALNRHRSLLSDLPSQRKKWDIVVLQSYRDDLEGEQSPYFRFASRFAELARELGARVILYETTPTTQNAEPLTTAPDEAKVMSKARSIAALAQSIGADAAPMSLVGLRCQTQRPDLTLRFVNDAHLNQTMAYLTACTLYAAIFNRSPQGLPIDSVTDIRFQNNQDRTKDRDGKPIRRVFSDDDRADLQRVSWEAYQEFQGLRIRKPPVEVSDDQVRSAVQKALSLLEIASATTAEKRTCFTCHSQGLPVMAFTEARLRGFPIDEANLMRQLDHTHSHLKRGVDDYRAGKGQGGRVDTAGYALWTLEAGQRASDDVTAAVTEYLLKAADDSGHWQRSSNRPPSESSHITTTYLALRGLAAFGTSEQQPQIEALTSLASNWLINQQPSDTEDRVFQLHGLTYTDVGRAALRERADELIRQQRDDGGWAQLPDMNSDAYATGTVLTCLATSGSLSTTSNNYLRGVQFLLQSQHDDGSWHVASRSKPFQEYFESGFPHGKDQFISTTATSWAVIALLQSLPATEPATAPLQATDSQ